MRRSRAADASRRRPLHQRSTSAYAACAVVVGAVTAASCPDPRAAAGLFLVLLAVAAVLLAVRCRSLPEERGTWASFALGTLLLCTAAPEVTSVLRTHLASGWAAGHLDEVGGLLGLAGVPVVFHGHLAALGRRRVEAVGRLDGWLDGTSTVLVHSATCGWLLVPLLQARGLSSVTAWTTALALVTCLVLTGLALTSCALTGWRTDRRLVRVAVVCALLLAAAVLDVLLALDALPGRVPHAATLGLRAGAVVLLVSAVWRPAPAPRSTGTTGWSSWIASICVYVTATVLVVWTQLRDAPTAAVVLAGAALLVVGVKTGLVFAHLLSLVESRRLALTDEVTGLPNRRAFFADLTDLTSGPRRDVHVMLVDLDRFKAVNDTFGHHVGDGLLADAAARLREAVGAGGAGGAGGVAGTVARIGGDEFAVLLPDVTPAGARECAARIARGLGPRTVDGRLLDVGASVGLARGTVGARPAGRGPRFRRARDVRAVPPPGVPVRGEDLLRAADEAMYVAKAGGGGVHVAVAA